MALVTQKTENGAIIGYGRNPTIAWRAAAKTASVTLDAKTMPVTLKMINGAITEHGAA